jgi:putative Mg2+ transporter-C (MgtC) family protein
MDIFIKLSVALLLGAILGLERIFAHRTAGPRTYALVAMGSALFIIVSEVVSRNYHLSTGAFTDPLRVASNIVVGIGFLGTGIIVFRDSTPIGITTAAGLWLAAGIGMAIGFGLILPAVIATFLTLFVFTVLFHIEDALLKIHDGKPPHPSR